MTMMMTPNCCIIMLDAQIESDTNKSVAGAGCLRQRKCSVMRSPQICSCIVGARAMGVRLVLYPNSAWKPAGVASHCRIMQTSMEGAPADTMKACGLSMTQRYVKESPLTKPQLLSDCSQGRRLRRSTVSDDADSAASKRYADLRNLPPGTLRHFRLSRCNLLTVLSNAGSAIGRSYQILFEDQLKLSANQPGSLPKFLKKKRQDLPDLVWSKHFCACCGDNGQQAVLHCVCLRVGVVPLTDAAPIESLNSLQCEPILWNQYAPVVPCRPKTCTRGVALLCSGRKHQGDSAQLVGASLRVHPDF